MTAKEKCWIKLLAQLLVMTQEKSLLTFKFVGNRSQTGTIVIQRCVLGLNYRLRRACQLNNKKVSSESDSFKELHQSLVPFNLLLNTQKKIQEALDKDKIAVLIRNQTSTKEKARLQSLCLLHSGAWLAALPVAAIILHLSAKEFQVSFKCNLGIAVSDQERKCLYCKSGTVDTFGEHAVACH